MELFRSNQSSQNHQPVNSSRPRETPKLPTNVMKTNCNKPVSEVKLEVLTQLQENAKKLLCLTEEIQLNTNLRCNPNNRSHILKLKPLQRKLEYVEHNNCSIYKRLTRNCLCLNQPHFNDFVIHFNEDTKNYNTEVGEIIKNLKILKRFLYMGCDYTKNSLLFLNEGFSLCSDAEKEAIAFGCSLADICNVFREHSIVKQFILWPYKRNYIGDKDIQVPTANFLQELSKLEEGRQYLNYNTKIYNDIIETVENRGRVLEDSVLDSLNETLINLNPIEATKYLCSLENKDIINGTFNNKNHKGLKPNIRENLNTDNANYLNPYIKIENSHAVYISYLKANLKYLCPNVDNEYLNFSQNSKLDEDKVVLGYSKIEGQADFAPYKIKRQKIIPQYTA